MKQEICKRTGTGIASRAVALFLAVSMVVSFAPSFTGLAWAADTALSALSSSTYITVGTTYNIVATDVDDDGMMLRFVPSESALYAFTFSGCAVDASLYAEEDYDEEDGSYLSCQEGGTLVDFLNAGTTYCLMLWVYESDDDPAASTSLTVSLADVEDFASTGSATATVSTAYDVACFSYTPSESGWYVITSEGDSMTYVEYVEATDPTDGWGSSASWLNAGTTYYFYVYFYDEYWGGASSETGTIEVTVSQMDVVNAETDASYDITLGSSDVAIFKFVPDETKYYSIATSSDEEDVDDYMLVGYVLNEDLDYIYYDYGSTGMSIGNTVLTAGETYYVVLFTYYTSDEHSLTVSFESKLAIRDATLKLSKSSYTYNGKKRKPSVTVTYNGTKLVKGTDYTVSYYNNKNAGTAWVWITGKGEYGGSISKKFTIKKASQSLKVTAAKKTVKASKVKKKAQSVSAITVKKAKTTLSYKKTNSTNNLSVNSKTGKITAKKGLAKGTYRIKVKVTAKGTGNYKAASKTVTVTVIVK